MTTLILLSYTEYLHQKVLSHANISYHMAGIRALFIIYGLDTSHFKDERVSLFINAPLLLKTSKTITIEMLHQILQVCDAFHAPLVFKALYLFTFFSFLRLFNILPHAVRQFDVTRHLTRGDLIFLPSSCTIIIKWSKHCKIDKLFKPFQCQTWDLPLFVPLKLYIICLWLFQLQKIPLCSVYGKTMLWPHYLTPWPEGGHVAEW